MNRTTRQAYERQIRYDRRYLIYPRSREDILHDRFCRRKPRSRLRMHYCGRATFDKLVPRDRKSLFYYGGTYHAYIGKESYHNVIFMGRWKFAMCRRLRLPVGWDTSLYYFPQHKHTENKQRDAWRHELEDSLALEADLIVMWFLRFVPKDLMREIYLYV